MVEEFCCLTRLKTDVFFSHTEKRCSNFSQLAEIVKMICEDKGLLQEKIISSERNIKGYKKV